MESVEGKRREKRLSISRGKVLQVQPRVDLVVCSPSLDSKAQLSAHVSQTRGSVLTTEDLSLCFIDSNKLSSGLHFILQRSKYPSGSMGGESNSSSIR